MITSKTFTKDNIIDWNKEFGCERALKFSLIKFILLCFKHPSQTERIACRHALTQDEYNKIIKIFNISLIVFIFIELLLIGLICITVSIYGKSTISALVCIGVVLFSVLVFIGMFYQRKISWGLLFHAMEFDYSTKWLQLFKIIIILFLQDFFIV